MPYGVAAIYGCCFVCVPYLLVLCSSIRTYIHEVNGVNKREPECQAESHEAGFCLALVLQYLEQSMDSENICQVNECVGSSPVGNTDK